MVREQRSNESSVRESTLSLLLLVTSKLNRILPDIGKFLQAFVKVKVTRGSTVEEGRCEPGQKVDKDEEEGHLL